MDSAGSAYVTGFSDSSSFPTTTGAFDTTSPGGIDDAFISKISEMAPSQLLNISTRADVLTGDNVAIGGFIITGTKDKKVIVRAIGPSLTVAASPTPAPLPGRLANPTLALHDQNQALIVSNDDWRETQETEIEATGLAPSDNFESAIVRTLAPGTYTAIMRGKNDTTGIGLVEIYDLSPNSDSQLANISTRGFVEAGDNVLIGGIILGPDNSSSANVIVRAIGPSMSVSGVAGPLQDPTLELHDGNGALITSNDDWADTQQSEIEATGLAPTNNSESAILLPLSPGMYTAIVRGANNTTGIGLVEIYNLQ